MTCILRCNDMLINNYNIHVNWCYSKMHKIIDQNNKKRYVEYYRFVGYELWKNYENTDS